MAELSREEVEKIARLSKLRLTEAEVDAERARLSAVLGYVERLGELELDGVEPLARASDEFNRLADDEPGEAPGPEAGGRRLSPAEAAALWPDAFECPDPGGTPGSEANPEANPAADPEAGPDVGPDAGPNEPEPLRFIRVPKVLGDGGGA